MKTNAIIRIILYTFVILILVGILLSGIGIGLYMFDPEVSSEYTTGSVGNISAEIRNLEIEWASGTVTVKTGDVNTISFSETIIGNNTEEMVYKVEDNTLKIKHSKSEIQFGLFSFGSKDLTVTVPQNWICSDLSIEAASAKVNVDDLTAEKVDLEIASGSSSFGNCHINYLEVDTASGDVNYTGYLNKLECNGASADVTATLENTPLVITMECASGDLDLTLPPDSGFTASIESFSGDLESEFEISKNGNYYVCGDGSCKIELNCASGDIRIRKGK